MSTEKIIIRDEIISGIKTFFITPELSCMPEDFLPNFFLKGFETYYLMDDPYLDIASKIEVLFSIFPELLLFFNIDRRLSGIVWPEFIRGLKEKYADRAMIGVLHNRKPKTPEREQLERTYLYDIGIVGGCIPVGYRKAENLILLTGVLTANQANGRRKFLRAICSASCGFNLDRERRHLSGTIKDVSISHFSCVFDGPDPNIPMYEKCANIQLNLSGTICTVNGVVCAKRVVDGTLLYVFVFRNSLDHDGLDAEMLSKVNGFIHATFGKNVMGLVNEGFDVRIKKRRAAKVAEA
jgi:hypothetical protein